jgi:hypothetical protein
MGPDPGAVMQHYHTRYPACRVLTTVGGSDRWAYSPEAGTVGLPTAGEGGRPPLFSEVRKTPSWPRNWANFSPLSLYSHRNERANLHFFGPT